MNENQKQSAEDKTLGILKEVHQKIKDDPEQGIPDNGQPSAEEVAQEIKGSDADIDRGGGIDEQQDLDETAEQQKGAD